MIFYPKWSKPGTEATISYDASGYYMYLPALLIYKDIKQCAFADSIMKKYRPSSGFDQAYRHWSGNYVMKYSAGQSIMYLPFFTAAHIFAKTTGLYPADGFSRPYQLCLSLGMMLYAMIGLWVVRKNLLFYFSDKPVAWTLIVLAFGTNYLNYAAIDNAMTHNTLFFLYALLIYRTILFYRNPGTKNAMYTGILCGLCTLIRPTEILSLLIPVLWGIGSLPDLKARIKCWLEQKKGIATAAVFFVVITGLQVLYWKYVASEYIVYSYQDQGFNWLHPHLYPGLLSYKAGWLVYTPVMILIVPGFARLLYKFRSIAPAILLFSALFIYICFAWDIWWYGGSLGQRAMVQSYPILVFPLCAFFEALPKINRMAVVCVTPFIGLCIYYNLWLTYQAHVGGLFSTEEMNKNYFWGIFLKYKVDNDIIKYLDNAEVYRGTPTDYTVLYQNDFEQDTSSAVTASNAVSGRSLLFAPHTVDRYEYSIDLRNKHYTWLRASADIRFFQKEWDTWKMHFIRLSFYKGDQLVKESLFRLERVMSDGETKTEYIDIRTPETPFDKVVFSIHNTGSEKNIMMDNIKVTGFN